MEFRVGSAPVRSPAFGHGSLVMSDSVLEPPLSGFLNRKCVTEAGGKKSKRDRSWQTFWCQLKGVALEFHRVEGVKSEGFKPPPRDIYPPPHLSHHKAGFVSVDGAKAEVDYTSQLGKDLQKRRDWLFELTLSNNVVYLLQSPNNTQRAHWVQHINKAATGSLGDDVEGRKLKAARCSVRHRSRQNVLSLKASNASQVEGNEADLVTAVRENPHMQLLRDRLRAKKELLNQINRMCYSFLGDTRQLYSEEVRKGAASSTEPVSSPRRLSLPSPFNSSYAPLNVADSHRASTGTFTATLSPSVRTRLLQDHLLVPGASWSQLREGDEVVLTGMLASGWFRCVVQRDVSATVHGVGSVSVSSHLSEASGDSGLPPSNRHSAASDTLPDTSPTPATDEKVPAASGVETEMFVSDSLATEDTEDDTCSLSESSKSHYQTNESHDHKSHDQESSPRVMRVGRSYSYIAATQTNFDVMGPHPRRSLDATLLNRRMENIREVEGERNKHSSVVMLEERLSYLTESQTHTNSYMFPLVGVLPPSVVEKVPAMADLPLVKANVFSHYSAMPLPSPAPSLTQLDTPQHSIISHQQSNGHISTPTHSHSHSLTPSHSPLPARKTVSSSAPVSPNSTPVHTPSHSPTPPAPHTATIPNGEPRDNRPPRNLSLSHAQSPTKPSHSPTRRQRGRRRSNDPVTAVLESGPSFIKKLFPHKKPSKQTSLPEKLCVSRAPTIEEEEPYSPSPSPLPPSSPTSPIPPPAMLDFSERGFNVDPRMRVSSVSGRPIRSTGICLQFGEEESSSESDLESSNEEPRNKLALSQSLPTSGGPLSPGGGFLSSTSPLTSALLLPPRLSPDIMAPGNLRRAASAHDSLSVKVDAEREPISQATRGKSGSTHSLTSTLVRGLQASFKRNHGESVSPKKKSSSKRKRRGSISEGGESESPRLGGIFRQPPTGQKRFVYLDPRQPKYGFRLESYGRPSELGQEIRVFVQSVSPGSPAFMSGLFPGDTILEVNGVSVRSEPVAAVVKKITDVPRKSENKVKLTVMFVDGVTRLEKMKKADHLKYQMKMKQAQLRLMISEESSHMTNHMTKSLPPARSIVLATDLPPWSHQAVPSGPAPHLYPYDSILNELVSLYSGPPSELATDVLVLPLCVDLHGDHQNLLTQLVLEGGSELADELSLSAYCALGENITTSGYQLPSHTVYHCVFGNLEENLQRCIWRALEEGFSKKPATIAFWLDGFTAINVSPHCVIEFVRLWLQQGGNSHKFEKIVFSASTNPEFAETLLERYFPLTPYQFKAGTRGSTKRIKVADIESQVSQEEEVCGESKGNVVEAERNNVSQEEEVCGENKVNVMEAERNDVNDGVEMEEDCTEDPHVDTLSPNNDDEHNTPPEPHLSLAAGDHPHQTTPPYSPSSSPRMLNPHRQESDV